MTTVIHLEYHSQQSTSSTGPQIRNSEAKRRSPPIRTTTKAIVSRQIVDSIIKNPHQSAPPPAIGAKPRSGSAFSPHQIKSKMFLGCSFFGWVLIFLERGSRSGLCPVFRGVADWCGFFLAVGGWSALSLVRMGAERRFASPLQIYCPPPSNKIQNVFGI